VKDHSRHYLTAKIHSNVVMPFSTAGMISLFLLLLHDTYTKIHIVIKVVATGALPSNHTKSRLSTKFEKKLPQSECPR